MKCPRCGYVRRMGETAPEAQCPSCGVIYAKAGLAAATRAARSDAEAKSDGFGRRLKTVLVLVAAAIGFVAYKGFAPLTAADLGLENTRIVMYSTTTCGYCKLMKVELDNAGIPFTELNLDLDEKVTKEFWRKAEENGIKGGIGTPTYDVNGVFLPNNPSLQTILRHAPRRRS